MRALLLLATLALGCAGAGGDDAPPGGDGAAAESLAADLATGASADLAAGDTLVTDDGGAASDGSVADAGPGNCANGVRDGKESDVDCGGGCPPCATGKACGDAADCDSGACMAGKCVPAPGFAAAVNLPAMEPDDVVPADLDGNGKIDLVSSSRKAGVCVLLGKGGTMFAPVACTAAGKNTVGVAVADFDGDKKPDVAAVNVGSNDVSILVGKGDGAFKPAAPFPVGELPRGIVAGDWNGDARADVAVADSGGTGDVAVLLGSGDGKLGAATKMAAQNPGAIAAGDANGDGKVDLVVTHLVSLHPMEGIGVFAGKGDGTFLGYVPYASGMGPQAVTMADLDGDGKVDLAVANKDSNDVSVLLGVPGGFGAPSPVPAGALAVDVVVADFNRDGKLDLAVANQGGKVRILLGKGNGAFNPPLGHPANKNPRSLAVADFNGDGKPDLAVANSTSGDVSVLLNSF